MNEKSGPSDTVKRVADDIGDQLPVDWDAVQEKDPDSTQTLEGLRLIAIVADAHQSARGREETPASSEPEPCLFTWGGLEVVEKIGEGGFAEVFRALDPKLQRQVALKLRSRDDAASVASQWIGEARRLAGVRHPSVLVVHGAAVHDEREGIWTDLIEGVNLTQWVNTSGRMGAREAAIVVMDACLAVNAVHASGLVHGDVKASNIMRDVDGHLVLMDFGSGHRMDAALPGPHSGTPLTSAPELLQGHAPTPASDVYSLGVLLYWLVSESYPFEADSIEELVTRLHAGESTPLLRRRPDLPHDFVAIVDRALELDPEARWPGPSEMEAALAAMLTSGSRRSTRERRGRRWLFAAVVLLALGAFPVRGLLRPDPPAEERVLVAGKELSVDLQMMKVTEGGLRELASDQPLAAGTQLALRLECASAVHVYVLNQDDHGDMFVLFPIDESDLHNPLMPDGAVLLPGQFRGQRQNWVVTSAGGKESFLAVVSLDPIPLLEDAFEALRQASADRTSKDSTDRLASMLRGVGGVTAGDDGGYELDQIARTLVESGQDPQRIWVWTVAFPGN